MSTIWGLLASVLGETRRRNVTPSAGGQRYVDALVAGARKHLEDGHQRHMRSTITRYKLVAERGSDPDSLRDVQAYVQVRSGEAARGELSERRGVNDGGNQRGNKERAERLVAAGRQGQAFRR
jgi:hypothetical protein